MARRTVRRYELREIDEDLDAPVADGRLTPEQAIAERDAWRARALKAEAYVRDGAGSDIRALQARIDELVANLQAERARAEKAEAALATMTASRDRAVARADQMRVVLAAHGAWGTGLFPLSTDSVGCNCDPAARPTGTACCAKADQARPVAVCAWGPEGGRVDVAPEALCADRYRDLDARLGKLEGDDGAITKSACELIDYVDQVDQATRRALEPRIAALEAHTGGRPSIDGDLATLTRAHNIGIGRIDAIDLRLSAIEVAGDPERWLTAALDALAKRKAERG